jgi:predicted O-methyltransferase YrrM
MTWFRALTFIKYFLFSRHRSGHGIHSPFVFDLVSRVFRNKTESSIVLTIEAIRKELISSTRSINVTDLGSGSSKMKADLRKVSDIARYSPVNRKYGNLLASLAREYGRPAILELGTSLGISTMYMAMSSTYTRVYTVEGCRATSEIALENFRSAGISNIVVMNRPFDEVLPEIGRAIPAPGLVFIDGNHRKEPLIHYCREIFSRSGTKTVIIIDDIHSSPEMEEAWQELTKVEEVTLTIDIYQMGFLFFRKGLNHLNYTIRY